MRLRRALAGAGTTVTLVSLLVKDEEADSDVASVAVEFGVVALSVEFCSTVLTLSPVLLSSVVVVDAVVLLSEALPLPLLVPPKA